MFKFVSTKNINELFQRAILHNDIQRTKLILSEAMKDPRFNIDQINEEGLTALQYSCFAGNVEIVKILVTYGANWKIRDRDGYTLMHASAMSGNGAAMRYLLQMGLKPTLKTDEGLMPIDVTDDISIVVILLRAMLDQGFLQEMQDYMMDHPKLKRNIFKELEKVKCREQEKAEILNEMPYTSHTPTKRQSNTGTMEKQKKTKSREGARRSTSTFSELSDSMQQLDKLDSPTNVDMNNNVFDTSISSQNDRNSHVSESESTLTRDSSFSSGSSSSGTAGILRYRGEQHYESDSAYRDTQHYLENRFPPASARPKSVTFDFDPERAQTRRISEHRAPPAYNSEQQKQPSPPLPSSTQRTLITSVNEPLYENATNTRLKTTRVVGDDPAKVYSQTLKKQAPPPLPPRAPTTKLSDGLRLNHISYNTPTSNNNSKTYEENYISDRQLGSETDSGIDVNETAGRMFALSVNDRDRDDLSVTYSDDVYSKPIGVYYSEHQKRSYARHHTLDDNELPANFAVTKNSNDQKYKSWNGRTFHEEKMKHYKNMSRADTNNNFYDTRYSDASENLPREPTREFTRESTRVTGTIIKNGAEQFNFSLYDFDNQPEIML